MAQAEEQPQAPRGTLIWQLDTRVCLAVLTSLFVIAALYLAQNFFIPLLLGILSSYALCPIVDRLERWRMPRVIGAGVVLSIFVCSLFWIGLSVSDDVAVLIEKLPGAARSIRKAFSSEFGDTPSALQNMRKAAQELQNAALPPEQVAKGARVVVASPEHSTWLEDYTLRQSAQALTILVQLPIVLLLAYFLLASGGHFRRKLVKFVGPSLASKKELVRLLDDVDAQVQYYLLTVATTNTVLAIACWLAFWTMGLEAPGAWGLAAGVLHTVPYVGPALVTIACATAAFLQTNSLMFALGIAAVSLGFATLTGYGFQMWMQSRMARVHSAVLFIGVLFFAWLWGMWGLLLGAPLIAIIKVVCDHVAPWRRVGELLAP